MICEQTTHKLKEGYYISIKYIREHWHEWLWLFVGEGQAVPHFYLPTHRDYQRAGFIAWIMPLAPFVLFFVALWRGFINFWSDCIWAVERWRNIKRPPNLNN